MTMTYQPTEAELQAAFMAARPFTILQDDVLTAIIVAAREARAAAEQAVDVPLSRLPDSVIESIQDFHPGDGMILVSVTATLTPEPGMIDRAAGPDYSEREAEEGSS